eukprot:360339-Chlamydomonas_euryale.AAC.1
MHLPQSSQPPLFQVTRLPAPAQLPPPHSGFAHMPAPAMRLAVGEQGAAFIQTQRVEPGVVAQQRSIAQCIPCAVSYATRGVHVSAAPLCRAHAWRWRRRRGARRAVDVRSERRRLVAARQQAKGRRSLCAAWRRRRCALCRTRRGRERGGVDGRAACGVAHSGVSFGVGAARLRPATLRLRPHAHTVPAAEPLRRLGGGGGGIGGRRAGRRAIRHTAGQHAAGRHSWRNARGVVEPPQPREPGGRRTDGCGVAQERDQPGAARL